MRWICVVCLAGVALAEERPIDALPWNGSLAEALEEGEDRGAPLAVYVYKAGEEGEAPAAIGASEATRAIYGFALYRLDVSANKEGAMEFAKRWAAACDLERLPVLALIGPDGQVKGQVSSFSDPKSIQETCEAVVFQLPKSPVEAGFYRNARGSYRKAKAAIEQGEPGTAMVEFEIVVAIASNCGRDFRFTAEARKTYQGMVEEGRKAIQELKAAVGAKDWKRVWTLGRPLAERYQLTALATDVNDLLAAVDADPEAVKAIEAIVAEEEKAKTAAYLARVALNRGRALEILRTRVPATEVPDDAVTVIFWDGVGRFAEEGAIHIGPERFRTPDVVAIGFWLGEDRAAVISWDLLHDCECERDGDQEGDALQFVDLRARDDVERTVFALMRNQARWEERPVVPVSMKPGDHGKLDVAWYAGWDRETHRWSRGLSAVDGAAGTVEDRGHVK